MDKGTYVLQVYVEKPQKIKPGKLPEAQFKKGTYLYVGRALTGLQARLNRHKRCQKKIFWHIDYLLQKAQIVDIWVRFDYFDECCTAQAIHNGKPTPEKSIRGFGSSDCKCPTHLFYFPPKITDFSLVRTKLGFQKVENDGNNP
jgi:Uri superfamily endonuclease